MNDHEKNKTGLPVAHAARSLAQSIEPFEPDITIDEMICDLEHTLHAPGEDIEAILVTQTRVLDALFNRFLDRALNSPHKKSPDSSYISEEHIHLALKLQRQCRQTLETLHRQQKNKKTGNELNDHKNR